MGLKVDVSPSIELKDAIISVYDMHGIETIELAVYNPLFDTYDTSGHADENPATIVKLPIREFRAQRIRDMVHKYCKKDEVVAVSSRVVIDGLDFHLPQIDFTCKVEGSMENVVSGLVEGNQTGYLVSSGNSYHFYGDGLLSPEDWKQYMKTLGDVDITGDYWLMSNTRGYSALRISACRHKPHHPKVVAHIGDYSTPSHQKIIDFGDGMDWSQKFRMQHCEQLSFKPFDQLGFGQY